jgi:hypothetical protein
MKNSLIVLLVIGILLACSGAKSQVKQEVNQIATSKDTVRIANDSLEYEVIIIDPGFNAWLNGMAKPRNFYSQEYLEGRNRFWVLEWNNRANMPMNFNPGLYEMRIDYEPRINYGYEVNYMLFNYLTYFQLTNNVSLGGLRPRL